ncbi:hypothetical protein LBMAG21_03460 [Armatimonadota bacterium]|nr:hypothetical protein LBMAG21_03460 [Armatimonadota bacterium]
MPELTPEDRAKNRAEEEYRARIEYQSSLSKFDIGQASRSSQQRENQIDGVRACGLIIAVAFVGLVALLVSSTGNIHSSVTPSYTEPTPAPVVAESSFADKELNDIVARLSRKTGEAEQKVRDTLVACRQVLTGDGVNEPPIEYARHIDETLPDDMNGHRVELLQVCALYNAEKKMNKQGKGLFGEDLAK